MEISSIDSTRNSESFMKRKSFYTLEYRFIPRYKPVGDMLLTLEAEKEAIKYLNRGILGYYCIYLAILIGIYITFIGNLIGGYFLYIEDDTVGYGICIGISVTSFLLVSRGNLIKKDILRQGLRSIRLVVNFINSEILQERGVYFAEPMSVFEIPIEENGIQADIAIN